MTPEIGKNVDIVFVHLLPYWENVDIRGSLRSIEGFYNHIQAEFPDKQIVVGEAIRRALIDQPGIEFHYCSDPLDALSVAKKVRPTVILQDLVMPSVNGLDLVRDYRADPVTANIPVIVLSTKEEATVKRDAFRIGANDYLAKLPDAIELVARADVSVGSDPGQAGTA